MHVQFPVAAATLAAGFELGALGVSNGSQLKGLQEVEDGRRGEGREADVEGLEGQGCSGLEGGKAAPDLRLLRLQREGTAHERFPRHAEQWAEPQLPGDEVGQAAVQDALALSEVLGVAGPSSRLEALQREQRAT